MYSGGSSSSVGLRAAVAPFTLDYAEARTGVAAAQIAEAARMFATSSKAHAASGTGLSFGPHSNLGEHLVEGLNAVCGGYRRAGDAVCNTGLFGGGAVAVQDRMGVGRQRQRDGQTGQQADGAWGHGFNLVVNGVEA